MSRNTPAKNYGHFKSNRIYPKVIGYHEQSYFYALMEHMNIFTHTLKVNQRLKTQA